MKMKLFALAALVLCASVFLNTSERQPQVGVVVPMQHPAMDQIVAGIKEELPGVSVVVHNAQGDASLQHAIITGFVKQNVKALVPIGTSTTQMTLAHAQGTPVVYLAAYVDSELVKKAPVTGVFDELPATAILPAALQLIPEAKKLTLLYSPSDKVIPEIASMKQACAQASVELQLIMVQSHADLYTATQGIDPDSQGVLVLKDHLIVSGMAAIKNSSSLPVIASDEGSVLTGADLAVGVQEKDIGREGGKLIQRLLSGEDPCEMGEVRMTQIRLFSRDPAMKRVADAIGYTHQLIGGEG